jgi:hypothetical protein
MNESDVLCLLYTNSNRTARALSTTRYVLRLLHTNFFTNKQPARTGTNIHLRYPYDTRTIPVRFTYDTRTIHVRYTYDTGSDQIIRFGLTQVRCQEWRPRDLKKGKRQKENNTWDSNVVPHRSTNQARTCLTSLSGREAVLSCWYGRSQNINVSKPLETI